jgi:hypothetical protein
LDDLSINNQHLAQKRFHAQIDLASQVDFLHVVILVFCRYFAEFFEKLLEQFVFIVLPLTW